MKSRTGFILGLFLLNGLIPALAEATPVDFQITGSLTGQVSGTGDQQQGEELVKNIPINGEIDVDLAYDFTLNDGESFVVPIDNDVTLSDLNLSHDISSFESYDITADFDPTVHTLNFELHSELSVTYAPFFGLYKPAEYVFQGFGFYGFDVVHNGVSFPVENIGDELTINLQGHLIRFTATRSNYGCGYLGAMGGFEISHLGSNPGPEPVPEPATLLLFGTGLLGLVSKRMRKKFTIRA